MVNHPIGHRSQATARQTPEVEERPLHSANVSRIMPDSLCWNTIVAVLLWGVVASFIFGILVDLIR